MKDFMSKFGLATIICLSLILSERTTTVVKNMDDIMVNIKQIQDSYYVPAIDAYVSDGEMIPGLNGRRVNVKKSYGEMKKIGFFNEKYLVYDEIYPDNSFIGKYDKVIVSGNKNKNMVSLIFTVYRGDDISSIFKILNSKGVKATFFVDEAWLDENNDFVSLLVNEGHTVGNLGSNNSYQGTGFMWINNIFKTVLRQNVNYCYFNGSIDDLKICSSQKNYTIKPDVVVGKNPLLEIKKNIVSGSLISLSINDKTNSELELIIDYINSRGFFMGNLTNHLSEKNC